MKKTKTTMAPPYPVRFDAITYLKVRHIAEVESRSMNKQIELAVKHMIASHEVEYGLISVDTDDLDE